MTTPYRERIAQLQRLVRKQGLGSLLVTSPVNFPEPALNVPTFTVA